MIISYVDTSVELNMSSKAPFTSFLALMDSMNLSITGIFSYFLWLLPAII